MKCVHAERADHHHLPIRSAFAVLAALAFAAVPAGAVAAPAHADRTTTTATAVAGCPTGWGSLPEASTFAGAGYLTNVRTGQHSCFDRIVFDVRGKPSWYRVHYVKDIATVGEGRVIPVRGGAKLEIVLSVPSYDDNVATYRPADYDELTDVQGYRTFRQVVDAGSFEGETVIGVGVRARLPFRVFTLTGPGTTGRVVVDVAHRW
ncbi:AMIN-like domain-containing (lipo)protein [Kribbella sp. CA-293567]|uniref:AMIN-like domain-containing (lipo)protein n=1 Tax=Kribbella sp. CA-293567 TaxID=3002436 RepID=UPI0022DD5B8A|nr:hypothetical protein [Kribbella sp. CA-293567]WBQ08019.1 hypothetical protein OX958_14725 [Kribbella sp. CA-293567]